MSQLSDWKMAHMCTENHVCFGRIHGSQLREGAIAGQHVRTRVRTRMGQHGMVPMVPIVNIEILSGTMGWYVRVNKAARDWLDALTAPEPGEQVSSQDDHPWNPQARTTTETVLREAMQALARVQAHMLARIVVEIRAADIAVELEP
jgi:hypothetical protein